MGREVLNKILLGMSGGTDSSVAAMLLQEQGYEVVGVTFRFFDEQKNGYDKEQVDNYISRLTEAYQTAYKEYLAVCDKYNNLMQDYKNMKSQAEKQERERVNSNTIARTLKESEQLAQEIIENAYNEEARINEQTNKNIERVYKTIEQSMNEAKKLLITRNANKDFKEHKDFNEHKEHKEHKRYKDLGGISNGFEILK